jgi:hypothetical protein
MMMRTRSTGPKTFKQPKPDHVFKTYPFLQLEDIDLRLLHHCWGQKKPNKVPSVKFSTKVPGCGCSKRPRIDELDEIVTRDRGVWTPRGTLALVGYFLVSMAAFFALTQGTQQPSDGSASRFSLVLFLVAVPLLSWVIPIAIRVQEIHGMVLKDVNDWLVRIGYHYRTLSNRRGYIWYWEERYWDDPKFRHLFSTVGYPQCKDVYWTERAKENPWSTEFDLATFETRFPNGTPF